MISIPVKFGARDNHEKGSVALLVVLLSTIAILGALMSYRAIETRALGIKAVDFMLEADELRSVILQKIDCRRSIDLVCNQGKNYVVSPSGETLTLANAIFTKLEVNNSKASGKAIWGLHAKCYSQDSLLGLDIKAAYVDSGTRKMLPHPVLGMGEARSLSRWPLCANFKDKTKTCYSGKRIHQVNFDEQKVNCQN